MENQESETGADIPDAELPRQHGRSLEGHIDIGALAQSEEEYRDQVREEAIANSEVTEAATFGEDIVGVDEGGERVLVHMILDPRVPANALKIKGLSDDQIKGQFREALEAHCQQIGWRPDGEGPDFIVAKRTDGVWHAYAKTKQSVINQRKSWDEFPRMKVDSRTQDDIDTNRSHTTMG